MLQFFVVSICLSGTLRVRISPRHPGASPSAMQPDHVVDGLGALIAIASSRLPVAHPEE